MSWQYILKIAVTVAVVVGVSEIAKRSSLWGAVLASLPLTSLLAIIWLWADTGNPQLVSGLSRGVFWLVLASQPLFILLPLLLGAGWPFWPSLAISCIVTVGSYFGLVSLLQRFGVQI